MLRHENTFYNISVIAKHKIDQAKTTKRTFVLIKKDKYPN